jgi:hydroxylamine reductase (hybrid-cluster protein)
MENLARLPVVFLASDLEAAGRSIVAFGAAASGIPVVTAPVAGLDGAPEVRRFLETEIRESLGGHFVFEADPAKIAARALECLDERRAALNLKAVRA